MVDGSQGIGDRSIRSASWLFGRKLVATVVRLVAVSVLARQLEPAQFGVVALAAVVLQLATLVGEAGVGTYVVYDRAEGRERRAMAAFWLNLVITVLQCGACLAAIPLVTRVFPESGLGPVLAALVAVFFLNQLAVVPDALLRRELRHPVLARRDMAIDIGSAALSVVLAVAGAGVWSLVIPSIAAQPVLIAVSFRTAGWRPRLPVHAGEWRGILRYTAPLMGSKPLSLLSNDGDTLLVGKVLGAGPLGFYAMAWQLANIVGRNVTSVAASVTLPALALVKDDRDRLRAAYLRMVALLGLVCLPVLTGMFALAADLVPTLYGPGWEPSVDLLRIFLVFTVVRSLTSPSSMVYNVTGRTDLGFKFTIGFTPVYLAAILAGSRWGAAGIASAVTMVRVLGAVVDLRLAAGQMGARTRAVPAVLARGAGLALAAAGSAWLVREALEAAGIGPLPRLALAGAAGAAVYTAGLVRVRPPGYDDLARACRAGIDALRRRLAWEPPAGVGLPTGERAAQAGVAPPAGKRAAQAGVAPPAGERAPQAGVAPPAGERA